MSFSLLLRRCLLTHEQDSNRAQLRNDAKRLFFEEEKGSEAEWETRYDPKGYRSRKQATRHAERDGTAFATIALPAHYSAILAVFDHVKRRLGVTWNVERIIEWGAGTGSGLWFDHSFQGIISLDYFLLGLLFTPSSRRRIARTR